MRNRLPFLLLLAACQGAGPMHVALTTYPGVSQPNRQTHECGRERVLPASADIPEGCQQFADLFLGEGGETHPCGVADLEEKLLAEMCAVGADTSRIIRWMDPQGGSSCYQLRAEFFECEGGEQ